MSRTTDAHWYWEHRGRYQTGMWSLQLTRRQRKATLKKARDGRRMRPPIKGLRYYHFESVRMFLDGKELTGFADGSRFSLRSAQRKVVNEYHIEWLASFTPQENVFGISRGK